ncbi:zinc-finger domain-containing protein [Anaerotalea alkaliphila]|uniref:Zinc-finger domain-containing protein n=1 Tax=Anaerotalea alkaliphila TaxID=2662126 RepID=A0A7X5KP37_9FIRM|nr:zinc-finger domain-containing protein [Anaerotalea alkaliphila]NDL68493.1 zinc-finger domain-containing protein [Anaerotalea alkaliphila]
MGKWATKAADNVYYKARARAAEYDSRMTSREKASEYLFIDRTTLAKYELGILQVPVDIALRMSALYHAPELLHSYCCNECNIGKKLKHAAKTMELSVSSMQLAAHNRVLGDCINQMFEIFADGVVDPEELVQLEEMQGKLQILQKVLEEHILAIEQAVEKNKAHRQGRADKEIL